MGAAKRWGFSVQRERGSTRHADLWGGRSGLGVSRLAANALWSGPPSSFSGPLSPKLQGSGRGSQHLGVCGQACLLGLGRSTCFTPPRLSRHPGVLPSRAPMSVKSPAPSTMTSDSAPWSSGWRGTSGWIPVPAQPGRELAPGGKAAIPGHSARRAAGRAAGLAGGRPWAGPPAPRVAVQVGTMTLSRHASFSHSNFGATGQRGRFIIVGLDQQPALPEPRCPRPAQAPGLGRPTAQLGQSPATLSPLAQPHPSRDPLAFLAFCPFGLSRSWARAML